MDDDGSTVASRGDRDVKSEQINGKHHDKDKDASMADPKPTYKSWKKKYRKMRVTFDHKMHDCEDLHKQEQKALAMAKRIALENEYVPTVPRAPIYLFHPSPCYHPLSLHCSNFYPRYFLLAAFSISSSTSTSPTRSPSINALTLRSLLPTRTTPSPTSSTPRRRLSRNPPGR